MNTFTELNTYSSTLVTATDERTFPFAEFVGDLGLGTVNTNEDGTQIISSIFGRFQTLEATKTGTANLVTVTIDLSNSVGQGAQVVWGNQKPSSVTVSDTGGVWTATNILTTNDYDFTLGTGVGNDSAYIEFVDQDVDFTFTITASYPGENGTVSHQRTYNVIIGTTSAEMSFHSTTTQQPYEQQIVTLSSFPQVTDTSTNPNNTYTMVINPSTSGKLTFQTTQSFSFSNSGAEGISIGPFTKSALNGFLSSVKLSGVAAGGTSITFQLTNNLTSVVSNGTMTGLTVLALAALSNANVSRAYTENQVTTNTFASNPIQLRSNLDSILGYGTYLIVLGFSGSAPYGGLWRENGTTAAALEIEKSGTVAQINTFLANNVNFIPDRDQFATHQARVTLYHGASQVSDNELDNQLFDIVGTEQTGTITGEGYYEYTSDTILTITDNMKYFLHCDMYVVGAGGSSNTGTVTGGGGGGSVTYTLDSNIVYNNSVTALQFLPGATNSSNSVRAGDTYVKNYSGGSSGATLIYAPGGGGGASDNNANGIAGGCGGGGAANTGTGGGTVTATNSTTSLEGVKYSTSGQPFASHSWKYIENASGEDAGTNRGGNGGGAGINTDVKVLNTNVLVGSKGYGVSGTGRPTESSGYVATYKTSFGRGAWASPTDTDLLVGRPGAVIFRFYQA